MTAEVEQTKVQAELRSEAHAEVFRPYHWLVAAVGVLGYAFVAADAALFPTVFPLVQADLGFDLSVVSYIYAAGFFACGIVAFLLIGPLTDRFGRKPTFIACVVVSALATIASGFAWDSWSFAVFRIIGTIGYVEWGLATALIAESVPSRHRAWLAGLVPTGWAIGFGLSAWVSGQAGPVYGWRPLFIVMGCLPILFAVACVWLIRETPHFADMAAAKENGRSVLNVDLVKAKQSVFRQMWAPDMRRRSIGVTIYFFFTVWQYGILSYYGLAYLGSKGIEFSDANWATSVAAWAGILAIVVVGLAAKRWGSHLALTALGGLGAGCAIILALAPDSSITPWYILYLFVTLGLWGAAPNFLNEAFPTRIRGTGVAWGGGLLWTGFGVLAVVVTPALDVMSWDKVILWCAIPIQAIALIGLWMTPRPATLGQHLDELVN